MAVSINEIKKLRELTGVSVSECKKALEEAGGDIEKAKEILRKRGEDVAQKKSERQTGEGIISVYVHSNNKLGVLLDLRCETDFVARSEEFKKLAHELCLQIASMKPSFVKPEDIPQDILEKEREIYTEQLEKEGKPDNIINNIVEGKLEKFKKENCLLLQQWIKNPDMTIDDLIKEHITKFGENIRVERFVIYEI